MKLEEIKVLAEKIKVKLTAADKRTIEALCAEYGVTLRKNTNCKNCWIDAVMQCYHAAKYKATPDSTKTAKQGGFRFLKPSAVKVDGWGEFSASTPESKVRALQLNNPRLFYTLYALPSVHSLPVEEKPVETNEETTPEEPQNEPTETPETAEVENVTAESEKPEEQPENEE